MSTTSSSSSSSITSSISPMPSLNGVNYETNNNNNKQRTVANVRERKRTQLLNQAYKQLQACIPKEPSDKMSKIHTLKLAMAYIQCLNDILKSSEQPEVATISVSVPSTTTTATTVTTTTPQQVANIFQPSAPVVAHLKTNTTAVSVKTLSRRRQSLSRPAPIDSNRISRSRHDDNDDDDDDVDYPQTIKRARFEQQPAVQQPHHHNSFHQTKYYDITSGTKSINAQNLLLKHIEPHYNNTEATAAATSDYMYEVACGQVQPDDSHYSEHHNHQYHQPNIPNHQYANHQQQIIPYYQYSMSSSVASSSSSSCSSSSASSMLVPTGVTLLQSPGGHAVDETNLPVTHSDLYTSLSSKIHHPCPNNQFRDTLSDNNVWNTNIREAFREYRTMKHIQRARGVFT